MRGFLLVTLASLTLAMIGCGGGNSSDDSSVTDKACPGTIPARHVVQINSALPDFNGAYRVEWDGIGIVDSCTGQKDFQSSRNFRNLTLAKDFGSTSEVLETITLRIYSLGDCAVTGDEALELEVVASPVDWKSVSESVPGCATGPAVLRANSSF